MLKIFPAVFNKKLLAPSEKPTLMPLTFGRDVLDEGEFAQLVCIVSKGDEPLHITWSLKGDDVSSEPGLTTTTLGARTSMLTISSVGYRHSGLYTCMAKNRAGVATETAELRVNGIFLVRKREGITGRHKNRKLIKKFKFQSHLSLCH